MRLFVAVPIPRELASQLFELARTVPGMRATPAANLHVTVHFLGRLDASLVPALGRALAVPAAATPPFALEVERVAGGPRPRPRAPMLWAHLAPAEPFAALAGAVAAACEPFGVPLETRPPRPHVTLARAPRGRQAPVPEVPQDLAGAVIPVAHLVLMRSRLSPAGATYEPVAELPLRAS
jgi:2'-5' RNA ligase